MRKFAGVLVLMALCALPVCAQQKLGTIVSGNEGLDVTVKQAGGHSVASLDFYSKGDSYRLNAQLDNNDTARLQQLIGSATSMDLNAIPVNRHLSLGSIKGVSVEVERASGGDRLVTVVDGAHRVAMDPPSTDRFVTVLNNSRRAMAGGSVTGDNTPVQSTGQSQDDATRLLHHWHGQ